MWRRTKHARLSSKEYSISSGITISFTESILDTNEVGAGVVAVCMGMTMVEDVSWIGICIIFGVRFSSSSKDMVFNGVENELITVFCGVSLVAASSIKFVKLDRVGTAVVICEKGCRLIGDSKECFFEGRPATSSPLLPIKTKSKWS